MKKLSQEDMHALTGAVLASSAKALVPTQSPCISYECRPGRASP